MKRHSFIVSMLLLPMFRLFGKSKNSPRSEACKTQRDQEGPYYKGGAPMRMVIESEGEPVTIQGSILKSSDCRTPIVDAAIDIWHCDSKGRYDNDGFKCRGVVKSDKNGKYSFSTIFPPSYGSRPRHIHFKVRAEGFAELTSQIYFKGDENLQNDFARNAQAARVISLNKAENILKGQFDIYL
jgi:catechol 1,2-dioxygenase